MSMTGYGNETIHINDVTLTVEIRTVNSRYLDFIAKIPRSLFELELEMKKIIQSYFNRGRIELYISLSGSLLEKRSLHVDWALMDDFFTQLNEIKRRYHLDDHIPLSIIQSMDELFSIQEEKRHDDTIGKQILQTVDLAARKVMRTRKKEGAYLVADIEQRIGEIATKVKQIDERKMSVYEAYHERIKERIENHLTESPTLDHHQLLHEVAMLVEKSDITEEITRLYSHLDHFNEVLKGTGAVGRKLDFIVQEILREANTLGAKSVDATISELVVQIKSNLEKIKEQVQNIE